MVNVKFRDLLMKKESELGRKIPLTEIADEIGVSRNTLSKILNMNYTRVNTIIIDKICKYFECKEIGDLVEYIPGNESERREMTLFEIKSYRRIIKEQIPSFLLDNLDKLEVVSMDIKLNNSISIEEELSDIYIDILITDIDNKKVSIVTCPKLYWGFDRRRYSVLQSYYSGKVIFITCTKEIPSDLNRINNENLAIYYTKIFKNDYENKIVDITLEKIK